jgi:hypothetical protein
MPQQKKKKWSNVPENIPVDGVNLSPSNEDNKLSQNAHKL